MSALGQKQTLRFETAMSAIPPKADIPRRQLDVRFVPIAEVEFMQKLAQFIVVILERPRVDGTL
jgi:hypothetical protein